MSSVSDGNKGLIHAACWLLAAQCTAALGCSSSTESSSINPGDSGTEAGPTVPVYLRAFESDAESMGGAARAKDWTKASGVLAEAIANWQKVKPVVTADGASVPTLQLIDDALTRFTADVTSTDSQTAERDANAISLVVPDLFDLYPSWPVPSDALRFDALFRAVQVDGEWAVFDTVATDHANVVALWARFRDRVSAQATKRADIPGAQTVVADLDGAISAEKSAADSKDGAGIVSQSQRGLDLVDICEQIFE